MRRLLHVHIPCGLVALRRGCRVEIAGASGGGRTVLFGLPLLLSLLEAPDLLASKYSELALRELEECPSSFTELLLAVHGSSGGGGGSGDLDSDSDIGRALLEALPAVFGPIDDDGDGEPGADDHGFGNLEVFDVLQSWVLRRTNIRPLTNVPLLRVVEEEGAAADADTSSVGGHAAAAMDDGPRKSESRACAIA